MVEIRPLQLEKRAHGRRERRRSIDTLVDNRHGHTDPGPKDPRSRPAIGRSWRRSAVLADVGIPDPEPTVLSVEGRIRREAKETSLIVGPWRRIARPARPGIRLPSVPTLSRRSRKTEKSLVLREARLLRRSQPGWVQTKIEFPTTLMSVVRSMRSHHWPQLHIDVSSDRLAPRLRKTEQYGEKKTSFASVRCSRAVAMRPPLCVARGKTCPGGPY